MRSFKKDQIEKSSKVPLLYCSLCKHTVDLALWSLGEALGDDEEGSASPSETMVYYRPNREAIVGPCLCPTCGSDALDWY